MSFSMSRSGWGSVVQQVRRGLLGMVLVGVGVASLPAQQVKVIVSSQAGDRLTAKADLQFQSGPAKAGTAYTIKPEVKLQKMVGFGASFLEAGMVCLNDLPAAQQEAVLRALFDPIQGAGFSAMKTPIAGTDFMSAGPYYTYDDTPGDVEMKHFSIQRDLGPNGLITYIKRARKYGSFALQSPMDYPPDWMLKNVEKDQDVNPKYYDALAHYYLRYLQEYAKQGVFIDYLSLFNEPHIHDGGYTAITYPEIRDLLKNHVGPLLKQAGLKNQIMLSEAPLRREAGENYATVLSDPGARRYIKALPYHGYDYLFQQTNYDKIAALRRAYPELPLWMTEVCYIDGSQPEKKKVPVYEFADGVFWGKMIAADVRAGASAWVYWNTILDQKGGPWMVSTVHRDPDPNAQQPVVIINRQTKEVYYTGLYYFLSHFSKYVRPGASRVAMSGNVAGVEGLAFLSPESNGAPHWVVELLNSRAADVRVGVEWQGKSLAVTLPATSITTCLWKQ